MLFCNIAIILFSARQHQHLEKEKAQAPPTLSGSPQASYTMGRSAPISAQPNCVCRLLATFFEVVIRERLSKIDNVCGGLNQTTLQK